MNVLDKEALSYQIGEILGLPRDKRAGKAYQIVKALCQALTSALQSGQSVRIDGFGTFKIHTRPATRHSVMYSYSGVPLSKVHREVKSFPPAPRVIFTPSKALLRYINV